MPELQLRERFPELKKGHRDDRHSSAGNRRLTNSGCDPESPTAARRQPAEKAEPPN